MVVDGTEKLREGSKVEVRTPGGPTPKATGSNRNLRACRGLPMRLRLGGILRRAVFGPRELPPPFKLRIAERFRGTPARTAGSNSFTLFPRTNMKRSYRCRSWPLRQTV